MRKDIQEYFLSQYKKSNIKVVPGHHPDFKTKEEVDRWFKLINTIWEDDEEEIR